MRVTIVENTALSRTGQIGVALAEAGARIDTVRAFAGDCLPPPPGGPGAPDALVVLGGEQNALADDSHPYLPALSRLMRAYAEAGRAVLGVCLGSQILARGCGGENQIGAATEFGWHEVSLTGAGRRDPVLSAAGERFPIFQWHDDSFSLPPGAVHLARSCGAERQAFRFGRAAYGTQFHFEANRAVVEDWVRTFPALIEAKAPGWTAEHRALAADRGGTADAAGLAIARAWVARI